MYHVLWVMTCVMGDWYFNVAYLVQNDYFKRGARIPRLRLLANGRLRERLDLLANHFVVMKSE